MLLEHRLSALLQLHLHSPLNTWLQYVAQRQLQAESRSIWVFRFSASYIRDFTVISMYQLWPLAGQLTSNEWLAWIPKVPKSIHFPTCASCGVFHPGGPWGSMVDVEGAFDAVSFSEESSPLVSGRFCPIKPIWLMSNVKSMVRPATGEQ